MNAEKINEHRRNDPDLNAILKLYNRFYKFIKGNTKTFTYLGCDLLFFKHWIEFQFDEFMNWNNYASYWSYDHVTPISYFNLTDDAQIKKCFNWSNIRPIKKEYNSIKNNKIIFPLIWIQEFKVKQFLKQLPK